MSHVSSPRKGTELTPRVFATWQEQVNRALRDLADEFAVTVTIEFGFVSPGGNVVEPATVTGALPGAAVLVTPADGPGAVLFDGFVVDADTVNVRVVNPTAGGITLSVASFRVLVFNS